MNEFYSRQIFSTIFYLSNKIQTDADTIDHQITIRQWMTLLAILHLPEGANYNQLASMMGFSKQNAKKIVTVLERKGFVTIQKSDIDRRAVHIQVTQSCRAFLRDYYERGCVYLDSLFHDFDEEEMQTLYKLLKKLSDYDGSSWSGYEKEISLD